jgi:(4S)-4-hydroxy-5-phosphonooxypentane-2,3-dione isomerase
MEACQRCNAMRRSGPTKPERGAPAMHLIFVKQRIKADHIAAFEEEIRRHVAYTRQHEPGCVQFDVATDKKDPRTYYFVEVYRDDAALAAHRASPSLEIYRPKIAQWVEERDAKEAVVWPAIK